VEGAGRGARGPDAGAEVDGLGVGLLSAVLEVLGAGTTVGGGSGEAWGLALLTAPSGEGSEGAWGLGPLAAPS
jgi:hypothetical protein